MSARAHERRHVLERKKKKGCVEGWRGGRKGKQAGVPVRPSLLTFLLTTLLQLLASFLVDAKIAVTPEANAIRLTPPKGKLPLGIAGMWGEFAGQMFAKCARWCWEERRERLSFVRKVKQFALNFFAHPTRRRTPAPAATPPPSSFCLATLPLSSQ